MSLFKKKSVRSKNDGGLRHAAIPILIVAALSLVLAPSVGSILVNTAAAEPLVKQQQNIIARDAVGDVGGDEPEAGQGNDNGDAGGLPPGAKAIIGGNVGATKQFSLDISATGKVSGKNALATVHIEGIVDIDTKQGTILRVQEASVTGNAEIKDNMGNTAATYDLDKITFKTSGAKLTVNADFTDQDGDTGKLAASLFAKNKINANSATITFDGNSNQLSIKYATVNQQFVATGKNVEADLSLT